MGNGVSLGFLCAPLFHYFHFMCMIFTLPTSFMLSHREGMIFPPCYDVICFNFNLTVMDVTDFLNYCAPGMQNTNSYNSNKVISFFPF